jgi:hypothetical protein
VTALDLRTSLLSPTCAPAIWQAAARAILEAAGETFSHSRYSVAVVALVGAADVHAVLVRDEPDSIAVRFVGSEAEARGIALAAFPEGVSQ